MQTKTVIVTPPAKSTKCDGSQVQMLVTDQITQARDDLHRNIDRVLDVIEKEHDRLQLDFQQRLAQVDHRGSNGCAVDDSKQSRPPTPIVHRPDDQEIVSQSFARRNVRKSVHLALQRPVYTIGMEDQCPDSPFHPCEVKESNSGKLKKPGHAGMGHSSIFGSKVVGDGDSGKNGKPVFADADHMKDQIRAALTRPTYDVRNYYREEGIAQKLARHPSFEFGTLAVITMNALWIAVDLDHNNEDVLLQADPIFQVAENFFCLFFTSELLCRFAAFEQKRNSLRDSWFVFDLCLVCLMVAETWFMSLIVAIVGVNNSGAIFENTSVLKLVRLVRLLRMARMVKLLWAIPELVILIKGILTAARSVFFTLVLLAILLYLFAILFKQLTKGSDAGAQFYSNIPDAMSSLLLDGVLPDQAVFIRANAEAGAFIGFCSLFFVLMASLLVMNMLIGLLCEVVGIISAVEKEQLSVNFVKQRLMVILGDKEVTKDEFVALLTNPSAAKIIQDLGVDVLGLLEYGDVIFRENNALSFAGFMELILELRGNNTATVKDIVDLRKFISTELDSLSDEQEDYRQSQTGINSAPNTSKLDKTNEPPRPAKIKARQVSGESKTASEIGSWSHFEADILVEAEELLGKDAWRQPEEVATHIRMD